MKKSLFCCALTLLAATSGLAQETWNVDCSSVLSEKLLDTTSTDTGVELILDFQKDICSRDFETKEAAQSYARSGGLGLKIPSYGELSVTDAKTEGRSSFSYKDSVFCDQSSSEVANIAASQFKTSTAKFAFDAFKFCVDRQDGGTFMTYNVSEQGRLLRAQITKRVTANTRLTYAIEGFSVVAPQGTDATCEVRTKDIRETLKEGQPVEIEVATANITCFKSGDDFAVIDIATTESDFGITMPSEVAMAAAREEADKASLRATISGLETDLAARDTDLGAAREKIAGQTTELTQLKARLRCARTWSDAYTEDRKTAYEEIDRITKTTGNLGVLSHYANVFLNGANRGNTTLRIVWKQMTTEIGNLNRILAGQRTC